MVTSALDGFANNRKELHASDLVCSKLSEIVFEKLIWQGVTWPHWNILQPFSQNLGPSMNNIPQNRRKQKMAAEKYFKLYENKPRMLTFALLVQ